MRFIIMAIALAFSTFAAEAQMAPIILSGHCSPQSKVEIGSNGSDAAMAPTQFHCNSVIMTMTTADRTLIQFATKGSDDSGMIGFAGTLTGNGSVELDHVYLGDGHTIDVSDGFCLITPNRSQTAFKSIACGVRVEGGEMKTVIVVGFEPALGAPRGKRR